VCLSEVGHRRVIAASDRVQRDDVQPTLRFERSCPGEATELLRYIGFQYDAVEGDGILPYHHDSEEGLRSFESTCRKFRRFLEQQPR